MFLLLGKMIHPLYPDKDTFVMLYQTSAIVKSTLLSLLVLILLNKMILEISLKVLICNFLFLTNIYNFPQRTLIFWLII